MGNLTLCGYSESKSKLPNKFMQMGGKTEFWGHKKKTILIAIKDSVCVNPFSKVIAVKCDLIFPCSASSNTCPLDRNPNKESIYPAIICHTGYFDVV